MEIAIHIAIMHTTDKGVVTELMVASRLTQTGCIVLRPFTDNARYDLVIEKNGLFSRVQCKTGRLRKGVILYNSCSSSPFVQEGRSIPYTGQVDFFGVYCPDNDKCYLVPVEEAPGSAGSLRIDAAKNSQKKRIRMAIDFEIMSRSSVD